MMIPVFPEIWYSRFGVREYCRGEQSAREIGGVATDYFTALGRTRFDKPVKIPLGGAGRRSAGGR